MADRFGPLVSLGLPLLVGVVAVLIEARAWRQRTPHPAPDDDVFGLYFAVALLTLLVLALSFHLHDSLANGQIVSRGGFAWLKMKDEPRAFIVFIAFMALILGWIEVRCLSLWRELLARWRARRSNGPS